MEVVSEEREVEVVEVVSGEGSVVCVCAADGGDALFALCGVRGKKAVRCCCCCVRTCLMLHEPSSLQHFHPTCWHIRSNSESVCV